TEVLEAPEVEVAVVGTEGAEQDADAVAQGDDAAQPGKAWCRRGDGEGGGRWRRGVGGQGDPARDGCRLHGATHTLAPRVAECNPRARRPRRPAASAATRWPPPPLPRAAATASPGQPPARRTRCR